MENRDILLEVKNLQTHFLLDEGTVKAVDGVDFTVPRGITVGIVGESGCGKSVTAMSILQLIDKPGRIVGGQILLNRGDGNGAVDLASLEEHSAAMRAIRGDAIAMIFQEPMNSLSPVHTIGNQIIEAIRLHRQMTEEEARDHAIEVLRLVGIPRPEQRIDAYTFQLSGGMRQRAMIAMALACNPLLLIADEPTTALDVTTQAQILELMKGLQRQFGMAVMLITHDLGVVAETCDEVVVMYLGEVVEQSSVDSLFHDPKHPYTQALLRSIPRLGAGRTQQLNPIEGAVPDPFNRPTGCPFHPRCDQFMPGKCDVIHPDLIKLADGRAVRCLLYEAEGSDHG
ncbi:MAG: dipeptide/oligopeptide/nickel ABC transporter ATP-binding protein [Anaerolineaceae bacterium]|nr:dipeptide/oligopeptide/nickel ABC transporter ATP-binding protein [Anaerolineaceae bacterium]